MRKSPPVDWLAGSFCRSFAGCGHQLRAMGSSCVATTAVAAQNLAAKARC